MAQTPQRPEWTTDTKRLVAIIILITAVALVYLARSMLSLVILAAILAYIFQPLVGRLARLRVPRAVGVLISLLLLLLIISIAPIIAIPALIDGVAAILEAIARVPQIVEEQVPVLLDRYPSIEILGFRVELMESFLVLEQSLLEAAGQLEVPSLNEMAGYVLQGVQTAGGVLGTAASILSGVITAVGSGIIAVVLLVMYTFFLAKDGPFIRPWLQSIVLPAYWPELDQLLQHLHFTWQNFFRGQLLLSLTVGTVTGIAALVLGLPAAFVLGLLAGVMEIVPNLGPVLAAIPAVLLALIDGSSIWPVNNLVFALIVIGVYVLIQQVENNFLVPRIMSQSLNLHPLVVLIGVVVGTSVAGILGAFLAAPVLASLKVLFEYAHAKLVDEDPFPPPEAEPQAEAGVAPTPVQATDALPVLSAPTTAGAESPSKPYPSPEESDDQPAGA